MQDLRSKLEMYKGNQARKAEKGEKPANKDIDLCRGLDGLCMENEDGRYFVIEKRYPLMYLHGGYNLGELLKTDMSSLACAFEGLDKETDICNYLFLDTETTGLSSGAGTVAFLIGTGFFEKDCFVLRQYFMRDYDEEPAVLRALNQQLSAYKGLVTFNGKSFDWNLLQGRFAFNRIRIGMKEPVHLDLLFVSRRIWKLKLESCKLSSIEENILGEHRVGDIPGAMIPAIYFKYLEDRNTTEIKKVISHNEMDILSMVSLMVKIAAILRNPLFEAGCERELLGIGKIFESASMFDVMLDCYENCKESGDTFIKELAMKRLAGTYKKNGDYENAVKQWEQMVANKDIPGIYPLIELAKYYEHKKKDIAHAMVLTDKAMKMVCCMGLKGNIYYNDIKKRYDRLKRKAEKINA